MKCKTCKNEISDNAEFCGFCGAKIYKNENVYSNKLKIFFIVIVGIVVLMALAIAIWYLSTDRKNFDAKQQLDDTTQTMQSISKKVIESEISVADTENDKPCFDKIFATSTLASEGSNTYYVDNLVDNNKSTAWVEGSDNEGIGQSVVFKSDKLQKISRIKILNGYCKSKDLYLKNNRVKAVKIIFSDGTIITRQIKDLYNEFELIEFDSPIDCDELTLEIQEVYKGSKYNDTCISEIVVE